MRYQSVFHSLLVGSFALLALVLAAAVPIVAHPAVTVTHGPAVTITEYPLPMATSTPGGLVVGPDRAIWFAESDGNRIGRIALNGTITEYPIPTPQSSLSHQAFVGRGPDGDVWFTESRANKLGWITPGGHITEYPIPTAATVQDPAAGTITTSFPIAITAGPDHAIWFNESAGNKIGRLTRNGEFTEFPLPSRTVGRSASLPDLTLRSGSRWRTRMRSGGSRRQARSRSIPSQRLRGCPYA